MPLIVGQQMWKTADIQNMQTREGIHCPIQAQGCEKVAVLTEIVESLKLYFRPSCQVPDLTCL